VWKLYLHGCLAIEQADFDVAEPLFLQAFSLAFVNGMGEEDGVDGESLRLAARVLDRVGWIYRRKDRPVDAIRTHLAAYSLRRQHGSFEEVWETATELGLDADVARRYEDARRWHRVAIEVAEKTAEEPARRQAVAWTNLSRSCGDDGKHDEAVSAARTARNWWREHELGAVTAARADGRLGGALLKQGEALHGGDDKLAKAVLDESVEWLATAAEALAAFGPDHAAEAQSCLEQKDFAERLRDSLGLSS
jgi:hypothetical protein